MAIEGSRRADGGAVERLADLRSARCTDLTLRLVELEAPWVPIQAGVLQEAPHLRLRIGDQGFVLQLKDRAWGKHLAPTAHQAIHRPVIAAELPEVISEGLIPPEQAAVAGHARIGRVPPRVDDPCAGQGGMEQA